MGREDGGAWGGGQGRRKVDPPWSGWAGWGGGEAGGGRQGGGGLTVGKAKCLDPPYKALNLNIPDGVSTHYKSEVLLCVRHCANRRGGGGARHQLHCNHSVLEDVCTSANRGSQEQNRRVGHEDHLGGVCAQRASSREKLGFFGYNWQCSCLKSPNGKGPPFLDATAGGCGDSLAFGEGDCERWPSVSCNAQSIQWRSRTWQ